MSEIQLATEEKVIEILTKFLASRIENPEKELKRFSVEEFSLKVRYGKYESSLNASSAKLIVDFQNSIYRIAALMVKGRADARLLTKEEKEELEIPFKISKGSTVEETASLLDKVGDLMNMIPAEQRGYVLVAIILIVFGYVAYTKYLTYKQQKNDANNLKDERKSKDEIIQSAIDKLSESNKSLAEIVHDTEKDTLSNLSAIGGDVEYQGQTLSSSAIEQIKRRKFPTVKKEEPKANQIVGNYRIISINLKQNNIVVDPVSGSTDQPLKLYYDNDYLLTYMQNLKEQLKNAIDNEEKIFHIEAIRSENGNKIMYSLYAISEVK